MSRLKATENKGTVIQQTFFSSNRSRTHIEDVESSDQRPQISHSRLTQLTYARDRIMYRINRLTPNNLHLFNELSVDKIIGIYNGSKYDEIIFHTFYHCMIRVLYGKCLITSLGG